MDKRITHIVYLSISVLLQPPGMKMNVPYAISSMDLGYMDVSQYWTKKNNKTTTWKHCQKQWNGLERTVLGCSLRWEVCVLSHCWTLGCTFRLNNKALSLADKHNHLFLLKGCGRCLALWQCADQAPGAGPSTWSYPRDFSALRVFAALWQSRTAWNQLSLVFAGAIHLRMTLCSNGIGSS